eukprot:3442246-Pleurochrysis_carterae.AAC.1
MCAHAPTQRRARADLNALIHPPASRPSLLFRCVCACTLPSLSPATQRRDDAPAMLTRSARARALSQGPCAYARAHPRALARTTAHPHTCVPRSCARPYAPRCVSRLRST